MAYLLLVSLHGTIAIWQALFTHKYDLAYSDHVNLASILALPSLVSRIRPIVWLHGAEVYSPRPDFEGRLGLRFAYHCLASSEFTRQKVFARYPGTPISACELALDPRYSVNDITKPIGECCETIELDALDGSRRTLGARVILFVGRMDPYGRYKGQATLLQALPIILKEFPDVQLVLAGDGPDLTYYQRLAASLPDQAHANIFLPGFVENKLLEKLYQSCFLFAMPSHGEGFGLVYLEAMRYARPCLGSRNDAASCVIQDGVSGILVDEPVSSAQVAESCLKLLNDPAKARQMGMAGFDLVRSRYLYHHFQERFWQALEL